MVGAPRQQAELATDRSPSGSIPVAAVSGGALRHMQRTCDLKNRVRETRSHGSVGGPGRQLPGSTRKPAIWHRGAGRADSSERDPISGGAPRCEVGGDVGRRCALPREALLLWRRSRNGGARKPTRRGDPEAGREQRVADLRLVLTIRGLISPVTARRRRPGNPYVPGGAVVRWP